MMQLVLIGGAAAGFVLRPATVLAAAAVAAIVDALFSGRW